VCVCVCVCVYKRYNTYIALQAATAAAAALYVTYRAGVQPIGRKLKARSHRNMTYDGQPPYATLVCRFMVSTPHGLLLI